tara:strand:+ start:177 stop:1280 length:1104 start_codon:yes stop_codon:yes gene_type:complete
MEGADVGEFVEIAASAGTDLSGWKLIFYNGNDNGQYNQIELDGIIENISDGYGFAVFESSQIQNGPQDAIALVNPSSQCVELISYEGVLTPIDGPCEDITSQDIGVSQGNANTSEESLQKTGTGTTSADFTWVGPEQNTREDVNNGQIFGAAPAPTPAPTPAPDGLLFSKSVIIGSVSTPAYDREGDYPTWDDTDDDCVSDRHEVLIAQHIDDDSSNPLVFNSSGCSVLTGKWYDPYDDNFFYSASQVQIDHIVALYESHISGAGNWDSGSEKRTYANTGNKEPGTLPETSHQFLAVGASSNGSKGSSDPTDWMPSNSDYHCTYLKKWVEIKHINDLYFDQAEYDFIKTSEENCDDNPLPTLPANPN